MTLTSPVVSKHSGKLLRKFNAKWPWAAKKLFAHVRWVRRDYIEDITNNHFWLYGLNITSSFWKSLDACFNLCEAAIFDVCVCDWLTDWKTNWELIPLAHVRWGLIIKFLCNVNLVITNKLAIYCRWQVPFVVLLT